MKTSYPKDLQVLLSALLISASMLAALPQVGSAWAGVKEVYDRQDFGLRILRGAMLVALANRDGANKAANLDGRPLLYTSPIYVLPPLEKGGTGYSTETADGKVRGLR